MSTFQANVDGPIYAEHTLIGPVYDIHVADTDTTSHHVFYWTPQEATSNAWPGTLWLQDAGMLSTTTFSGESGTSGYSGTTGESGSGASGPSGYSGISGYSGASQNELPAVFAMHWPSGTSGYSGTVVPGFSMAVQAGNTYAMSWNGPSPAPSPWASPEIVLNAPMAWSSMNQLGPSLFEASANGVLYATYGFDWVQFGAGALWVQDSGLVERDMARCWRASSGTSGYSGTVIPGFSMTVYAGKRYRFEVNEASGGPEWGPIDLVRLGGTSGHYRTPAQAWAAVGPLISAIGYFEPSVTGPFYAMFGSEDWDITPASDIHGDFVCWIERA